MDTTAKGKIKVSGKFTTKPGVTLDKVIVFAFPVSGGVMAGQEEVKKAQIDQTKLTWGTAELKIHVYKDIYAIRADGYFSDNMNVAIASEYAQHPADGDPPPPPNLTFSWDPTFPQSIAAKTISCVGTYTGKVNKDNKGTLLAVPTAGGTHSVTTMKINPPKAWLSDPLLMVPTGGIMYNVVGAAADDGGKFYSAPYVTISVKE
ncbi:MAG: hypothetical protein L0241_14270 [Planctomycetia bacterium]|nr:hypothetical protein [Planctomycetia bacterium]